MITNYIKGDLLSCNEKFIAHGCNAQGVMGAGIAKLIREKYPQAFNKYFEHHKQEGLFVGEVISVVCGDKTILNMITQETYGKIKDVRYVSYDALANCFHNINIRYPGEYVAIPKIGVGLGNGKWNVVESIINEYCPEVNINVYDPN